MNAGTQLIHVSSSSLKHILYLLHTVPVFSLQFTILSQPTKLKTGKQGQGRAGQVAPEERTQTNAILEKKSKQKKTDRVAC